MAISHEGEMIMAKLKNLPQDQALPLASLIDIQKNQVVSMALAKSEGVQMSLFSFAEGESVSEEEYFGDTLYYILEGEATVIFRDRKVDIGCQEVLMVPAHVLHAIEGKGPFKMLQLTLLK